MEDKMHIVKGCVGWRASAYVGWGGWRAGVRLCGIELDEKKTNFSRVFRVALTLSISIAFDAIVGLCRLIETRDVYVCLVSILH
jgi:hypothetical protein